MGMAAPSPKGQVRPGINITPLVDVTLVVLIIFMVVAPMLTKTFSLTIPPPTSSNAKPSDEVDIPLVMTIDEDGVIRINRTIVAKEDLASTLPGFLQASRQKVLNVDADDALPYGQVLEVLDLSRTAGAKSIAVVTKKLESR
jgi:biopolymer transport protein TolR